MADQPTTTETPADTETPNEGEQLGDAGKRALQAERDARKQAERQLAALQEQVDAITAEKMTDLERAQQAATKAQEDAEKSAREALRYRYASRHGISDEDAELFLTGVDEESVARQAERLAAAMGAPRTPAPDPSQGVGSTPVPTTNAERFAQMFQNLT